MVPSLALVASQGLLPLYATVGRSMSTTALQRLLRQQGERLGHPTMDAAMDVPSHSHHSKEQNPINSHGEDGSWMRVNVRMRFSMPCMYRGSVRGTMIREFLLSSTAQFWRVAIS